MKQFSGIARLATKFITDLEIADMSANNVAPGEIHITKIVDILNRDIELGSIMVAVFYGATTAIENLKEKILETAQLKEDEDDGG